MKKFVIVILLLLSTHAFSQQISKLDSTVWSVDYYKAVSIAKEKNMPLLLVFSGSDWCKPCIKLREQILVKPEFSSWAKSNVVCVTVDFPKQKKNALIPAQQKQNDALAERFNPKGVFPLVVVLNSNEKVLGFKTFEEVTPDQFTKELKELINKK